MPSRARWRPIGAISSGGAGGAWVLSFLGPMAVCLGYDAAAGRYSVPVAVYADDVRIATHARPGNGPRSTLPGHLPEHRAELGQRSRTYSEDRAAAIDPDVLDYVRRIFDQDNALSMLRPVQAIVTHPSY